MLVLGLQGSPRKKGNTDYLLSAFMQAAQDCGARICSLDVPTADIEPCRGCGVCEKTGYCVIRDDAMTTGIYTLMRQADVVVAASPIFFYSMSAQLKGLVDRTQALWSRKYIFKLRDPGCRHRRGIVLSVGASRGKQLFDSLHLIATYFFDAIGTDFSRALTYRGIEAKGEIKRHAAVNEDIRNAVRDIVVPLVNRKRVLFACRENACRSQMAAAFARRLAGDRLEALSGGSRPAGKVNADMITVMAEKGVDMAFLTPRSLEEAITDQQPEMVITMGCEAECPPVPGAQKWEWSLPDPAGRPIEIMRSVRDEIEARVRAFVDKR